MANGYHDNLILQSPKLDLSGEVLHDARHVMDSCFLELFAHYLWSCMHQTHSGDTILLVAFWHLEGRPLSIHF